MDPVVLSEAGIKGENFLAGLTQADKLPHPGAFRLPAAEGQAFKRHALTMDSTHPWQRCRDSDALKASRT